MEGRNVEAMKTARDLTATITVEEARKERWKELYLVTPIFSMIRFGRWEEIAQGACTAQGIAIDGRDVAAGARTRPCCDRPAPWG